MQRALGAVRRGDMGINASAASYGVPKTTLLRHLKGQNKFANDDTKFHGGVTTLPEDLENELVQYCLSMERRFFGIKIDELRRLAYDLAEANGIDHNFDKTKMLAGWKWYYGFMKRHKELTLRSAENTSMSRAQGFNKPRVQAFFELLGSIYDREQLSPDRLYNMDETSLSTVQDGQKKIIAEKGKKQVGILSSGERGESSTCVVCVSATGSYIPPMIIYKRKRMKEELTNGGPVGAVYSCQEKGWMSNEGFVTWLKHFIDCVRPQPCRKVVLVLDGHVTHTKNLTAIQLARDAGVVMVSLPPPHHSQASTPRCGICRAPRHILRRGYPQVDEAACWEICNNLAGGRAPG